MEILIDSRLTGQEPLAFLSSPYSSSTNSEPAGGKAHVKQCEQMTLTRRQKRACRREPGLAETLRESVRLSLLECRYQFRNERWNCSMDGRGSLLKRGRAVRGGIWCLILKAFTQDSPGPHDPSLTRPILPNLHSSIIFCSILNLLPKQVHTL